MPRFLTLAKYLPAALCGVLVVAWVASWFGIVSIRCPAPRGLVGIAAGNASCGVYYRDLRPYPWLQAPRFPQLQWKRQLGIYGTPSRLGEFALNWKNAELWCPIPWLLSLLLPFAVGAFNRFRFPLWSWFAWTALIAVELAYYLR